jgi:hypothetical protein
MLLLNSASELVLRTQGKENNGSTSEATSTGANHWKVPPFRFERGIQPEAELRSLDRDGWEKAPDKRTGIIQTSMLRALSEVESQSNQSVFDLWCEARMANGQTVRCWPQNPGNQGVKHDWVLVRFEVDEDDEDMEPYPAKVLAMYEDIEGNFKVLVHSVAYKTTRKVEGPHRDSHLVCHYRLDFNQSSGEPKLYSLPVKAIIKCIVAFESEQYQQPLVP